MLSNEPSVPGAERSHENMILTAWSQHRREGLFTFTVGTKRRIVLDTTDAAPNVPVFRHEMAHFADVQRKTPRTSVILPVVQQINGKTQRHTSVPSLSPSFGRSERDQLRSVITEGF